MSMIYLQNVLVGTAASLRHAFGGNQSLRIVQLVAQQTLIGTRVDCYPRVETAETNHRWRERRLNYY